MKNLIFFTGIVLLIACFYVIIEFPESSRVEFLAGIALVFGLGALITGYFIPKQKAKI